MRMADRHAHRRAGAYRHRAHQLTDTAAREPHEDRRRHLLELAAQYQRAADALAAPSGPLTDDLEREMMRRLLTSDWSPRER
jgi:hypothetical protein